MQGYAPIPAGTTLKNSLALLQANDDAAISNNSGTAFPTDNLLVGMTCFRTDLQLMHTLVSTNPVTWVAQKYLSVDGGAVDFLRIGSSADDSSGAKLQTTGSVSVNRLNGEGRILVGQNDGYFYGDASKAGWKSPTRGTWYYDFTAQNLFVQTNQVWHSGNFDPTAKLSLAGGTMTGDLTLKGNASNALHAVPKQQLDAAVGTGKNGFGSRTVSAADPSGGADGDIWYQV
ncbi:hypothetical protein [Cupriavidus sp. DL-D2]|uniref:hypothetical protein n=1 Tax=Cupriavidus sp. DL-D2 TaxID=3144974 RepID=UPI00321384A1